MSDKFGKCKQLDEYKDYTKYQTKSSASEFISAAVEFHIVFSLINFIFSPHINIP